MATTLRKCRFLPAVGGLADFVVTNSVAGFVLPVTALAEDTTYNYMAFFEDEWESGDGLYTTATQTLARGICLSSSNEDDFVNFSGIPTVIMTLATVIPSAGRLLKNTFFTTSQTWTKDPKTKSILAFVTAAGGKGGTTNGVSSKAGGGGAGATAIKFLDVTNISSYPIAIGASPGGQSSINTTTVVANGGGNGSNAGFDGEITGGGSGGNGGTGDIIIPGGDGQHGNPSFNGRGGVSYWAGRCSGGDGDNVAGKPGLVWILEFS